MDRNDLISNPLYSAVPGNLYHFMWIQPDTSSPPPAPAQPAAPATPRMGVKELDAAVIDLATRFADKATHPGNATRVSADDMKRQLGLVSPAGQKLLQLALGDAPVAKALRSAANSDGALGLVNSGDVTTEDLNELKSEAQRGQGKALTDLRSVVRVDSQS